VQFNCYFLNTNCYPDYTVKTEDYDKLASNIRSNTMTHHQCPTFLFVLIYVMSKCTCFHYPMNEYNPVVVTLILSADNCSTLYSLLSMSTKYVSHTRWNRGPLGTLTCLFEGPNMTVAPTSKQCRPIFEPPQPFILSGSINE